MRLSEATAAEVRAQLARKRISAAELGRRLGWTQSYTARRVDGRQPLDMDDLEQIADFLEIPPGRLIPDRRILAGISNVSGRPAVSSASRRPSGSKRPPTKGAESSAPRDHTRRPAMIPRPVAA